MNEEERNWMQEYIASVAGNLVRFADEHNIDRDDLIDYFAQMFTALSEFTTFSEYEIQGGN